jgi:hypothetical protein
MGPTIPFKFPPFFSLSLQINTKARKAAAYYRGVKIKVCEARTQPYKWGGKETQLIPRKGISKMTKHRHPAWAPEGQH